MIRWDGNAALLPTCSILALYFLQLLSTYLLPVCLHCEALRTSQVAAPAGRQSDVDATESCQEDASEKRITLIVAWWGPGIRAEPGAPGQGPCRSAPRPKPAPNTLVRTETAQDPDPGPSRAGPTLRAGPSHTAPQDADESSSESTATSATESDPASELEPAATATAECKSDSYPQCSPLSALPDTESSYSELRWLQQCRLLPHEQQAHTCVHPCRAPDVTGLGDSKDEMGPSQGGDGSSALLEKKMHGANSSRGRRHWYPAAKDDSLPYVIPSAKGGSTPGVTPPAKGYNPPTISPVWLPVNQLPDEKQCDGHDSQLNDQQDDQQGDWHESQQDNQQEEDRSDQPDDQKDSQKDSQHDVWHDGQQDEEGSTQEALQLQEASQPAAKRNKMEENCDGRYAATYRQQLVLPLPPLRYFVRSPVEISSVYQPRKTL